MLLFLYFDRNLVAYLGIDLCPCRIFLEGIYYHVVFFPALSFLTIALTDFVLMVLYPFMLLFEEYLSSYPAIPDTFVHFVVNDLEPAFTLFSFIFAPAVTFFH